MYGLLNYNVGNLTCYERSIGKKHICGLCNTLSATYGTTSRIFTNHDSTFLCMLCSAQTNENLRGVKDKCSFDSKNSFSKSFRFGAATSLLIAEKNFEDKIYDDKSISARILSSIFRNKIQKADKDLEKMGFDSEIINREVERQHYLEQNGETDLEKLAEPTGNCVSKIFEHTAILSGRPENREPLRLIGRSVGKLIYMLDNFCDVLNDARKHRFNAFLCIKHVKSSWADARIKASDLVRALSAEYFTDIKYGLSRIHFENHGKLINNTLFGLESKIRENIYTKNNSSKAVKLQFAPVMSILPLLSQSSCECSLYQNAALICGVLCLIVIPCALCVCKERD